MSNSWNGKSIGRFGSSARHAIIALIKTLIGDEGKEVLDATTNATTSADTRFGIIVAISLAGATIDDITDAQCEDEDALIGVIPCGVPIRGDFSNITISAGRVICYKKLSDIFFDNRKNSDAI